MLDSLGEVKTVAPLNDRMAAFIKKGNFGQRVDEIMKSPPEVRGNSYYGVSPLHKIREFYGSELGPEVMKEFHDEVLGRPGPDVYVEGRDEYVQPIIEWLVGSLFDHKDRFQYVFRTSRGSTYFVLPTGESMRFKMADPEIRQGLFGPIPRQKKLDKLFLEVGDVTEKCFFVDENEDARIKDNRKGMNFIDMDVQTIPFQKGAVPLEIDPSYNHNRRGFMPIEADMKGRIHIGKNVRQYHLGTQVAEIIHHK